MLLSRALTALVSLALGAEAHATRHRRDLGANSLKVTLDAKSSGEATKIKATIENVGTSDLSLLKIGTILDEKPVRKLTVVDSNGAEVFFQGIELSIYYEGLEASHFEQLAAGSSLTRVVDIAETYDLAAGTYSVYAEGGFPSAEKTKAVTYKSNTISVTVDKASTATIKQSRAKRTVFKPENCTAAQLEATLNGIKNCEPLARAAAADAADVNSARFVEYFKSNETSARNHVSGRLLAVADQCSTTDKGETTVGCHDQFGYCEMDGPLIAYTTWVNGWVTMCPLFYNTLPPLPKTCHKQDHATTTIHEMTHARAVYEQEVSTQDYAYGYENSTALDSLSCLYNADSYSLYANAVYLDC